jgi:DNA-binding NarL/FixJ family response regulator
MRILIADDHGIVREGLRSLIEKEPDMEVVGEAKDGVETVESARQLKPDIIIMDVSMPNLNGIEATRIILSENPKIKVIVLSIHIERRIVKEILSAGAAGYVLKTYLFEELSRALRSVMVNGYYLSPKVTSIVVGEYLDDSAKVQAGDKVNLTSREREVLQLIAEGKSSKQIALMLHVSQKTIETHRRKLLEKIEASGVAELTKYAIREGITSVEF